jgi:hypothetical protein
VSFGIIVVGSLYLYGLVLTRNETDLQQARRNLLQSNRDRDAAFQALGECKRVAEGCSGRMIALTQQVQELTARNGELEQSKAELQNQLEGISPTTTGDGLVPSSDSPSMTTGRLMVSVWPADASLYLDGNLRSPLSPAGMSLPVGRHILVVAKAGFESQRVPLDIQPGEKSVAIQLVRSKSEDPDGRSLAGISVVIIWTPDRGLEARRLESILRTRGATITFEIDKEAGERRSAVYAPLSLRESAETVARAAKEVRLLPVKLGWTHSGSIEVYLGAPDEPEHGV